MARNLPNGSCLMYDSAATSGKDPYRPSHIIVRGGATALAGGAAAGTLAPTPNRQQRRQPQQQRQVALSPVSLMRPRYFIARGVLLSVSDPILCVCCCVCSLQSGLCESLLQALPRTGTAVIAGQLPCGVCSRWPPALVVAARIGSASVRALSSWASCVLLVCRALPCSFMYLRSPVTRNR